MAVVWSEQKRSGGAALRKAGKKLVYEEDYEYIIRTDDKLMQRKDVLLDPNAMPLVNISVSGGGRAVCTQKDVKRDAKNPLIWHGTAKFSSDVEEDSSGANEETEGDPSQFTPIAELGFETYTEYRFTDKDGNLFVNGAGAPFAGGFPHVQTLITFEFEQFEPITTTDEDIAERNETVNSTSFKGKAARTLRLTVQKATIGYYFGFRVWRIGYKLTYKKDGWRKKFYNIGDTYLDGANKKPYLDDEGNRITWFLTDVGARSSSPTTLQKDMYDELNFSSFLRV